MMRIILLLTLMISGVMGFVWLFAGLVILYTFLYFGAETIIVAMMIDAYFGYTTGVWFIYTLSVSVLLIASQYVKPHLWVYNQ